jgi:alpha-N-arabinofuranosidase
VRRCWGHFCFSLVASGSDCGPRRIQRAPQVIYQRDHQPATFWGLNGSSSLKDKTLTLTVVNPHTTEHREAEIAVRGDSPSSVEANVLRNSDIPAHNTFDRPDSVSAGSHRVPGSGETIGYVFVPASVTRLSITLAQAPIFRLLSAFR